MQFQCRCECATDYVCIVPVTQDDKSLMTDIDAKSCIYIYIYIYNNVRHMYCKNHWVLRFEALSEQLSLLLL